MAKYPPPSPPFISARYHGGRQNPEAIVIHGTVSSDNRGTARNIAEWWHGPTSPVTSCHYVVDPGAVFQTVGDHTVAYHVGYNTGSIGVELCDEQVGPATRWKDKDSQAILARAARLVAELCLAYDIEPVRPTTAALKKRGPHGIYGHNDSRLAFGYTTHTDPRDFDWPAFLRLVRKEIKAIKDGANPPEPQPEPQPGRETIRVNTSHHSMQFSDPGPAQEADVEAIFARADKRGERWFTGTEAGGSNKALRAALKAAGEKYGYRIFIPRRSDAWIAVRKEHIKRRSFKTFYRKIIDGIAKRFTDKGVSAVLYEDKDLGPIRVIAAHYLTKGRPNARSAEYRQNLEANERFAGAIGQYAVEAGKGKALVFYGGDQNIVDRTDDTFFGQPMTSLWDELGKWDNTGHGNIDVIASYDRDGRVKAAYARALDDSEFPLHTDHFTVEGGFDVKAA